MKKVIVLVVVAVFLLSGCAPVDADAIEQAVDNEGYTAVSTDGVAIVTPMPTSSPDPTPMPTPSPTPCPYGRLSTIDAIDAVNELIEKGVPITNVIEYDEDTDPNSILGQPNGYIQKVNFTYYGEYKGMVELFDNIDDATAHAGMCSEAGFYVYQHDLAVFRLERRTYPEPAEEFESYLNELDIVS